MREKFAIIRVKGETSKCLTYLSLKWGLRNQDVVRTVFITFCEQHEIYDKIEGKKFRRN